MSFQIIIFILFISCFSAFTKDLSHEYFLEEDDNNIIVNIKSIDINNKFLMVTDDITGNIFIFDILSGKLHKSFQSNIFFSDSVAEKLKDIKLGYEKKYVTMKELFSLKGGEYDHEKLKRWIQNRHRRSYFENDSTILSLSECAVNSVTKNLQNPTGWDWGLENHLIIITYDIYNQRTKVIPLLAERYSEEKVYSPYPDFFIINPLTKEFLIQVLYSDLNNNSVLNDIYQTAYFSEKGNLLRYYSKKPKYFKYSKEISNKILKGLYIKDFDEFILLYPNIPYIFIRDKEIYLKELKGNINYFLDNYDNLGVDSILRIYIDSGRTLWDNRLIDCFLYNGNIIVYNLNRNEENKLNLSLMEFDLDGNYKNKFHIKLNRDDLILPILHIDQDKCNKILLIRKLEGGWYVKWFNNLLELNN